jgi:hypothetical protein
MLRQVLGQLVILVVLVVAGGSAVADHHEKKASPPSADPSKPGGAYAFRAKLPDGFSVPPHWHPMEENITVPR